MDPTPRELAEEARRILEASPMTSDELFEFLVEQGIIDRSGRVLVQKLFGENEASQNPEALTPDENGEPTEGAGDPSNQKP